jgi:hypothetical protein
MMPSLLVNDPWLRDRNPVNTRYLRCIQSEDYYDDDIYWLWNIDGNTGRTPASGYWRFNSGDRPPREVARIGHPRYIYTIRLKEYDRHTRDDSFDVVTCALSPTDQGGPYIPLPADAPKEYKPVVRQRSGSGRGKYEFTIRVLPPRFHFLSSMRDAIVFCDGFFHKADLPKVGELFDSFSMDTYSSMFDSIINAAKSNFANINNHALASLYCSLNACRRQLSTGMPHDAKRPAQIAVEYSPQEISGGVESEIGVIEEMLQWPVYDDLGD